MFGDPVDFDYFCVFGKSNIYAYCFKPHVDTVSSKLLKIENSKRCKRIKLRKRDLKSNCLLTNTSIVGTFYFIADVKPVWVLFIRKEVANIK